MAILLNFSFRERWGDDGLEKEAKAGKKTEDFNSRLMSFSVFCTGQAIHPNLVTDALLIHIIYNQNNQKYYPKSYYQIIITWFKTYVGSTVLWYLKWWHEVHARGFFSCKLKVINFQTQYLGRSLICILASGTAILQARKLMKSLLRNSCTMQVIFILKKKT